MTRSRFLLSIAVLAAGCRGRVSRVRHVIRSAGSDTIVNVAQAWAEHYIDVVPEVSVEVSGGGSATGIASLIDGTADIANTSRAMAPQEVERARMRTGKEPTEWIAGHDAIAVFVHRDNPVPRLTLKQLAGIYGRGGSINDWSQLGVGGWKGEILLISRQSNSGTYEYFRNAILGETSDFRMGTRDLNGSKEVVSLIESTPGAIGYSGMGYATPQVRMVPIARDEGVEAFLPTVENTRTGRYPISRPLYLYTLGQPAPHVRRYLGWILSPVGQRCVQQSGYVPIGAS